MADVAVWAEACTRAYWKPELSLAGAAAGREPADCVRQPIRNARRPEQSGPSRVASQASYRRVARR
jgi:hypothetical protein